MISSAIVQLVKQSMREDWLHLAFYHLLRSEVMRVGHDVIGDRMAAQVICDEIGSSLYRYFMTIEEVALEEKKLLNGTDMKAYFPGEYIGHELTFNCLGMVYENLNAEQMTFIDHSTLLDIFNMHRLHEEAFIYQQVVMVMSGLEHQFLMVQLHVADKCCVACKPNQDIWQSEL
jgi:hypothetical protein